VEVRRTSDRQTAIDVTQETLTRQRAEQVESEELAILDLLTAGVIVTDEHGTVVKVNQKRVTSFQCLKRRRPSRSRSPLVTT